MFEYDLGEICMHLPMEFTALFSCKVNIAIHWDIIEAFWLAV